MGCHFLLQGLFQTQGSNPNLLHLRSGPWGLYHYCHLGKCPFLLSLINHGPVGVLLPAMILWHLVPQPQVRLTHTRGTLGSISYHFTNSRVTCQTHLHSHPVHCTQCLQCLKWEGEQQAEPAQAWGSPFFVERSQLPSTMDGLGFSQIVRVVGNVPANAGT